MNSDKPLGMLVHNGPEYTLRLLAPKGLDTVPFFLQLACLGGRRKAPILLFAALLDLRGRTFQCPDSGDPPHV